VLPSSASADFPTLFQKTQEPQRFLGFFF